MAQGGEVRRMIDEKKLIEKIERMRHIVSKYSPDVAYACGNLLCELKDYINDQPQFGGWIPVTYHTPTREDGEECLYAYILDCPMPEEGQEILVSFNGIVDKDVCCYDEGWYLDNRGEWTDVDAWMPLPEPFKEEKDV